MAKKSKKSKISVDLSLSNLLTCAVYALVGLMLIILKGGSLSILMTVVGVLAIIVGVVDVFKNKDFVKGAIEIGVGIVIIVLGWLIADVMLLILGIVLIVKGVMEIWEKRKKGLVALVSPIVTVVIGILLVVAKWALMDVLCIIAGVIFLINALLTLFGKSLTK